MKRDDDELPGFAAWREQQRRLRELAGEPEPEGPFEEPTPAPRPLQ